jgi:A/G-specific adenine glycosylase
LHKAAQIIMQQHDGVFPDNIDAVQQLPGIGRSTAAAILAFAYGQRHAILDGNVKRVLTRCFGVFGWPGQSAIEAKLWELAEIQLPNDDVEPYTQGLMDLGATVCTRSQPDCDHCPLAASCIAKRDGLTSELPTPKPRKSLPDRHVVMLLLIDGHDILLEKRPPSGIWGGLWSFPEVPPEGDAQPHALQQYGVVTEKLDEYPVLVHTFTHFRLHITPLLLKVISHAAEARQANVVWLNKDDAIGAALPTAIRKLIQRM